MRQARPALSSPILPLSSMRMMTGRETLNLRDAGQIVGGQTRRCASSR
jgi:hypothetical protein